MSTAAGRKPPASPRAATAILAALVLAASAGALAAPRVPQDDGEVLQRLAATRNDPVRREEAALREALRLEPRNVGIAVRLAGLHIARARREGDPRQLGQAQAALDPWWSAAEPPVPVLLLRATLEQTNHEFASALSDLRSAVAREPRNAQAWLTLATVQQVTGDLDGARASCRHLAALTAPAITVTCMAAVDGATGRAASAYRSLQAWTQRPGTPNEVRSWSVTLQAELAERLGLRDEADASFRLALALDPADSYARAAYADFLLDAGRPREVVELIPRTTPSDPLLLRYVIAARAIPLPHAAADTTALSDRFAASRARGDRVHLREEARFVLEVERDAARALELSRANWQIQKEPADARILLQAALAAGRKAEAQRVRDWVSRTGLEDVRLASEERAR